MSDRTATFREVTEFHHSVSGDEDSAPIAIDQAPNQTDDDHFLLDCYCTNRCPESFQTLVTRHKGWIYALAKRHVKDRHLAEDVMQAVFVVLARKAKTIPRTTPLAAWLFRVARFAANDVIKRESRGRRRIDRAAQHLRTQTESPNESQNSIDVDEAIACMGEADRQVILLRFYEDKSMAQIGEVLAINEPAAKKRVSRAIMRLRKVLLRKGHALTLAAIAALLLDYTRAAHAADVLIQTGSNASASSMSIARSTLRLLTGARTRLLAALAGTSVVLVLGVSSISSVLGQVVDPIWQTIEHILTRTPSPAPQPLQSQPATQTIQAESSPLSRIWVGKAGEVAWPIAPTMRGNNPLSLHLLPHDAGAVAVIEDNRGQVWYRPIDPELVPPAPPVAVDQKSYEELNPYAASTLQRIMDDVLDMSSFPVSGNSGNWKELKFGDDGSISPMVQTHVQFAQDNKFVGEAIIPEPVSLAWICAATVVLLPRRRRRN